MAPKAKRPTPHLYSKQEGIELTAHNLDEILFKLIGSELTDIERAPDTRSIDGEGSVAIVFSNGAALRFDACGDPGSWLITTYLPPSPVTQPDSSESHHSATQLSGDQENTVEAIAARLAAATPGPWWCDEDELVWRLHGVAARFDNPPFGETVVNKQILKAPKANTPYAEYWPDGHDAAFITHAHADITWLLQERARMLAQESPSCVAQAPTAPTPKQLAQRISDVVADADLGEASALKRGRNPLYPYVPVIKTTSGVGQEHTSQLLGLAYQTRDEALHRAQLHIDALRAHIARQLSEPRYRALRESYDLPREITPEITPETTRVPS
jgi:hypothetical protein